MSHFGAFSIDIPIRIYIDHSHLFLIQAVSLVRSHSTQPRVQCMEWKLMQTYTFVTTQPVSSGGTKEFKRIPKPDHAQWDNIFSKKRCILDPFVIVYSHGQVVETREALKDITSLEADLDIVLYIPTPKAIALTYCDVKYTLQMYFSTSRTQNITSLAVLNTKSKETKG